MPKYTLFLLSLHFILSLQQAYAQSDFQEAIVITQEKDTLCGQIRITKEGEYYLIEEKNQREQTLSPENIHSLLIEENTIFESKQIVNQGNEQTVFLKLLAQGKGKLYHFPDNKEAAYWIETEEGKMYGLTNEKLESQRGGKTYVRYSNTYKGVLKNIFSDQPVLFSQIDQLKYTGSALLAFFKKYHELSGIPYEIISEDRPDVVLDFGLVAGGQFSSIKFIGTEVLENHLSPTFSNSNNFSFGIFAEAQPVKHKHSAIKLELQYQRASYDNPTLTLTTNILRVSPAYKYQIAPNANLRPYLSLGPAFNFLLSLKDESTVDVLDGEWLQSGRIQYGLEAGAGVSKSFSQNHSFFLEFRYGVYNGNHLTKASRYVAGVGYVPVQDSFDSISTSFGILGGIRF